MSHPIPPSPAGQPLGATVAAPAAPAASTPVSWPDAARRAAFEAWLAPLVSPHQLLPATLRPASADASFRRYLRIDTATGASRIVMDAPPDKENCQPFVQVQGLMAAAGLNVPQILAFDEPTGFMLLSDLGHQTVIERLNPEKPQDAYAWYQQATDVLLQWQKASTPGVLPAYDEPLLRRELALFPDWYLAKHRAIALDDKQQATLGSAFDAIVAHNLAAPQVYVHRDFMTRNLMAPVEAGAPLGVLDFQDAVYGPITYDIASLLRDAFISWEEEFVIDITVRYWEKARKAGLLGATSASGWGDDFGEFYRAVEWMGLQRHLKVAGIFARLTLRDGKPKYLADAPRFIAYIRATANRYRQLGPLLKMLDQIEGTEPVVGFAYGRM
ncbi:aminoglycoside/choline kinase family phosphotransferase [Acidovorax delafieldii]|uniref:Aminoglycoside/choline kinase family phosphotransferase n=1 Tax=Acidovorax delafieldii TaxID=47920 RepID=A0AAJ2BMN2_ACIDE|nr:phosphotransferase [Acidovorax delafieldii]MDR6765019.1 aminoglycoside/choline kinase family phosphotransferase [Acidovorax delafieldii]MDR6835456.1 aminoglycoside/choline kinase family phosphotransferase [Acidovorax delafieldii]MDR7365574.1 aminoglycoside/choline kinase family phosphotransferase [Acidovorax delafieldii]